MYAKGGTAPTTTDTAVLIGILDPDGFVGGEMRLDPALSEAAFAALDSPLDVSALVRYAWGVGVHNIAEGIFGIALRHGIDTRDFSLMAYGAAGPMLLPAVLDVLPLRRVIVPPNPGGFSALGLLSSDQVFSTQRSSYELLTPDAAGAIDTIFATMEAELLTRLGLDRDDVAIERSFDGRLVGQGENTPFVAAPAGTVDAAAVAAMIDHFHDAYELRNGNRVEMLDVQAITYRVEALVAAPKVNHARVPVRNGGEAPSRTMQLAHLADQPIAAQEYRRTDLCAGDHLVGPAVVREDLSTTFVPGGRRLVVGDHGELIIT